MLNIVSRMREIELLAQIISLKAEIEDLKKVKTLEDPFGYCCETMKSQLTYECDQHPDLTCPDIIINRSITFRPIGLVEYEVPPRYILMGRNAYYVCSFCPWCGADLDRKAYEDAVTALIHEEIGSGTPDEPGDPEV